MKVVACHHYLPRRGAEDLAFERDVALLERYGHVVIRLTLGNLDVRRRGRLGLVCDAVWNREICRRLRDLVRRERPDVVHFHNTFPLISPAAYYAARAGGAAVVQTLHHLGLFCPDGILTAFLRSVATGTRSGAEWQNLPPVRHACFRRPSSVAGLAAGVFAVHWAIGTYRRAVDLYLVTNDAEQDRYAKAHLPMGRIFVRPGAGTGSLTTRSADESYRLLMRGYELAIRHRSTVSGQGAAPRHDRGDLTMLRRRAVAARWRPDVAVAGARSGVPGDVWVPTASNLAIVRSDAPAAFQAKVA